jgi:hypothetical protein
MCLRPVKEISRSLGTIAIGLPAWRVPVVVAIVPRHLHATCGNILSVTLQAYTLIPSIVRIHARRNINHALVEAIGCVISPRAPEAAENV